jgi:hypothetical protein
MPDYSSALTAKSSPYTVGFYPCLINRIAQVAGVVAMQEHQENLAHLRALGLHDGVVKLAAHADIEDEALAAAELDEQAACVGRLAGQVIHK